MLIVFIIFDVQVLHIMFYVVPILQYFLSIFAAHSGEISNGKKFKFILVTRSQE